MSSFVEFEREITDRVSTAINAVFGFTSNNIAELGLVSALIALYLILTRDRKTFSQIWYYIPLLWVPVLRALECTFFDQIVARENSLGPTLTWGWAITTVILFTMFLLVNRVLVFWLDNLKSSFIKRKAEDQQIGSDIRRIFRRKKSFKKFNPIKYFRFGKIFIGLSASGTPIYISREIATKSSLLITGCSGSGKTLFVGVFISQIIAPVRKYFHRLRGSTAVVFDPKNDEFLARVLSKVCRKNKLPITKINLNDFSPVLCLAEFLTPEQHAEIFLSEPEFCDKGTDGDFHKHSERAALLKFTENYDKSVNLDRNWKDFAVAYPDIINNAPAFRNHMETLVRARVFSADPGAGINIGTLIEGGGVVYLQGHVKNPIVKKLQRILLGRIIQYVERREARESRHVLFSIEEAKHVVSQHVVTGIATLRDSNATFLYSCQSLTDSVQNDQNIPPEAIRESVLINTRYKVAFETPDIELARYYSDICGEITENNVVEQRKDSSAFSEVTGNSRSYVQKQSSLINPNIFLSLQSGCAVLIGGGLAQVFSVAPIMVSRRDRAPHAFTVSDPETAGSTSFKTEDLI